MYLGVWRSSCIVNSVQHRSFHSDAPQLLDSLGIPHDTTPPQLSPQSYLHLIRRLYRESLDHHIPVSAVSHTRLKEWLAWTGQLYYYCEYAHYPVLLHLGKHFIYNWHESTDDIRCGVHWIKCVNCCGVSCLCPMSREPCVNTVLSLLRALCVLSVLVCCCPLFTKLALSRLWNVKCMNEDICGPRWTCLSSVCKNTLTLGLA